MKISLINCPTFNLKKYEPIEYSRKRLTYKYVYDEKLGQPVRVATGFVDIVDFIQESADDIDFRSLGNALVGAGGDVRTHFFSDEPIVDVSQMPRNIHELNAFHNKMKDDFDKLPDDLKEAFGGDYTSFMKATREGTVAKVFEDYFNGLQQSAPAEESVPVQQSVPAVESEGNE